MATGYLTATLDSTRRKFAKSECVVTVNIRDSAGTLTNPTTNAFQWRYQFKNAADNSVTMVNTGTGIYTATFIPERSGNIFYRIETTTPTAAKEGTISIADTKFPVSV